MNGMMPATPAKFFRLEALGMFSLVLRVRV